MSCSTIDSEDKKEFSSKVVEFVKKSTPSINNLDFVKNSELEIENKSEYFVGDYRFSVLSSISENTSN